MRVFGILWLALALQQPAPQVPTIEGTTTARDSALDRTAREVSSGLRCPVCQGLSIQDSPADLAVEMKHLVREQLAAGKSPDEVRQYFIEKYGEWVLLAPEPSGFNLLVYLLPVGLIIGGAGVVATFVRRHGGVNAPTEK